MAPPRIWAHRTANLRALSYRFAVCCDDDALGRRIESLFSALGAAEVADAAEVAGAPHPHWYTLTASAEAGTLDATRDEELVHAGLTITDAIDWLMWDVNRAAAETSGHHLLFHSGGLAASGRGVLVPGTSGSGKSTLTAGLARAGLGYLSDELVALELETGRLLPYPKPITLKAGSFAVLPELAPAEPLFRDAPEWQVPVGAGTALAVGEPCPPAFVIAPRYDPSGPTTLVPLSETEAFFTLALHAVNLMPQGTAGAEALGRLAAGCECYALSISDLDEACRLVLGVVGAPPAPVGAVRTEGSPMEREGVGHGH